MIRRRRQNNNDNNPNIWKEILEELKSMNQNISQMNQSITQKLDIMNDNLSKKLETLPDRITEELFGNDIVKWGVLVIGDRLLSDGWTPVDLGKDKTIRDIRIKITGTGKNGK